MLEKCHYYAQLCSHKKLIFTLNAYYIETWTMPQYNPLFLCFGYYEMSFLVTKKTRSEAAEEGWICKSFLYGEAQIIWKLSFMFMCCVYCVTSA